MPKKLSKLEAVEKVVLDGHMHVFSNPRKPANVWWRDPGSRRLEDLAVLVANSGVNCIGITNAGDDNNYERWTRQAGDLPSDWGYYQDERATQILIPRKLPIIFIKSREYFTKQGHALVLGLRTSQNERELREIDVENFQEIDEAYEHVKKDGLLIFVADHPFSRGGLGINLDGRQGMFNAYEVNMMASRKANWIVSEIEDAEGKPLLYGSDAHRPRFIGYARNTFFGENLCFDSGDNFMLSLGMNIDAFNFKGEGEYLPFAAGLHHAWMIFLDHKLGFYARDKRQSKDTLNI